MAASTETSARSRHRTEADGAEMGMRVEQLADVAGVSVDTIRYYQKRRLLDPPRRVGRIGLYSRDHLARLERIRELQSSGLTLELIGRLVRGELSSSDAPLAAAIAAASDSDELSEGPLTLSQLAQRTGVSEALLAEVVDRGLLATRGPGDAFSPADVAVVEAGKTLIEQGLDFDELLDLARTHHDATVAVAERAVALFDANVRRPLRTSSLSEKDQAEKLVQSFDSLLAAVTVLVEQHFRRVLLAVAQSRLDARDDDPAAPSVVRLGRQS